MCQLLVNAIVLPSSPILVTLMMEALHSSVPSVLTQRNIPEESILQVSDSSITVPHLVCKLLFLGKNEMGL
jgi:hypothetical protein